MRLGLAKCLMLAAALLMVVGIGTAFADPDIPKLDAWVTPNPLKVAPPCPTQTAVRLTFENNDATTTHDVAWTSVFATHDLECVADYAPKNGVIAGIPPLGGTGFVDITITFIGDCKGKTEIDFTGNLVAAPTDVVTKRLLVLCLPFLPSLTQYGLIALAILIALTGLWMYRRKRATA
jgi:hypothetical protein